MKTDLFQSCGHCWVFQIWWQIEWSTFTASSFRIWNSSTGIPSPPPALFVVMLSKAHLTSHSRMSGLGEWSHHRDYLGHDRTGHGTTDWLQIGKGVRQGCILSPCLFICRIHHEKHWAGRSTSWNQDGGRNINNLRYADDTTLMAESKEELESVEV